MAQSPASLHASSLAAPCQAHPWRLVALVAAICFLGHFNRVSMAVAADLRIMREYGISTAEMGAVYSAFLLVYTLAMIPGGWVIDRFGPRFSLAVVCLGSAVFAALTGAVGLVIASAALALPALIAIRAVMGLVSAPLHPASAKAVSLGVPPGWRSSANGLVTGAALLGVASTYIVFGSMVQRMGWPGAFIIAAFATAGVGLLWQRTAGAAAAETVKPAISALSENRPRVTPWAYLRQSKNLILLTLSYGTVGYFQYLFFYWTHYYFETVLKLGSDESQYYATIPPLAMALGMPLGGWLSDRIQTAFGWRAARAGVGMAAMSAAAGLLLLGTHATEPLWIVTWLSLALGVLGMAEGPFWATAVEVGGTRGGLSAAIFNTGGNAIGALAPIATPWISDDLGFGWQTGIAMGSAVTLAGAVMWYWIDAGPAAIDDSAS